MRTTDAVKYYGTQAELARACEVTPQAVTRWMREGVIPPQTAIEQEIKTKGKLRVMSSLYARRARKRAT